ncbi:MAG: hypothetical protein RAP03_15960 [Candidatus Electryonea clarkiae]|nr:hypothetical protein [Candidatus Electryonea clarkiae]
MIDQDRNIVTFVNDIAHTRVANEACRSKLLGINRNEYNLSVYRLIKD